MIPEQNRNGFPVEIKELKEIDDQVLLIVKYVRELKQAEDVGDWDKVVSLSDAIQELYNRRFNGKVYKTKHLTKTQKIQKKIKHLKVNEVLRSIDEKYGSIDAAEGTREIAQLRKLLNA